MDEFHYLMEAAPPGIYPFSAPGLRPKRSFDLREGGSGKDLLKRICCEHPHDAKGEFLRQLADALGVAVDRNRLNQQLYFSESQIRHIASCGMEFGAHTMTHPYDLSALPWPRQCLEIAGSSRIVKDLTGSAPCAFAYPFGARRVYTARTIALLCRLGFASACTTLPGSNSPATSCYELRRQVVRL
jgi:hypothetical protein